MSWRPQVEVEGKWEQNGLVFATEAEAAQYAADLYRRWTITSGYRAVEVDEPVTHQLVDNRLSRIDPPVVPVTVITADGVTVGVLTDDGHGDVVIVAEEVEDGA